MPNSYVSFNDPTTTDKQAEANIEQVASGLFSVFVTLGIQRKKEKESEERKRRRRNKEKEETFKFTSIQKINRNGTCN